MHDEFEKNYNSYFALGTGNGQMSVNTITGSLLIFKKYNYDPTLHVLRGDVNLFIIMRLQSPRHFNGKHFWRDLGLGLNEGMWMKKRQQCVNKT